MTDKNPVAKFIMGIFTLSIIVCILLTFAAYRNLAHVPKNELWRITLGRTSNITTTKDLVLFESDNNKDCSCVFAAEKTTGKIIWSTEKLAEPYIASYKQLQPDSSRIPGIVDIVEIDHKRDIVYVNVNYSYLYALSNKDGHVIWGPIGLPIPATFSFSSDNNRMYLINDEGNLLSVDKENGSVLWKTENILDDNLEVITWMKFQADSIYVIAEFEPTPQLFAADKNNGQLLWQNEIKSVLFATYYSDNLITLHT